MNTNQKKLKLVKEATKTSTLNKMTDSQVDTLFSKLQEQVTTTTKQVKTITVPQNIAKSTGADIGNVNVKTDENGNVVATEMTEDDTLNVVQDPDATEDGLGLFEEKEIDEKFESKKQQKYFFAKCGDGKTKEQKKWCKMADEFAEKTNFAKLPEKKKVASVVSNLHMKNLDQTTTPNVEIFGESEIEKHIMRLVEKHITPKMSKKDFNNLLEGDTKTAPAKPKVSPGTKPKHPFQPDPDKKGAPKAMKKEVGEGTEVAPAKPKVSPGTTPKHPFAPDPSKQGAPKAIKRELPSFLKFNQLGLKTK
jgi:uncharacterized membrane protein YheB (UPF0754 family)